MNLTKQIEKYDFLQTASKVADDLGLQVFVVGGFVRDLLLKKDKKDIDFLIVGDGNRYAHELAKRLGAKKITVYKNFGTAQFNFENIDFEFVASRKESYNKQSRKPDVVQGTFEDDISRRDFTINTLAFSINKKKFGKLIDTYDGSGDIKNKIMDKPFCVQHFFRWNKRIRY